MRILIALLMMTGAAIAQNGSLPIASSNCRSCTSTTNSPITLKGTTSGTVMIYNEARPHYKITVEVIAYDKAHIIELFENKIKELKDINYDASKPCTHSYNSLGITANACVTVPKQPPLTDDEIIKLREKIIERNAVFGEKIKIYEKEPICELKEIYTVYYRTKNNSELNVLHCPSGQRIKDIK